ncbi:MAG: sigma-70 family RNA polymerase sigma factor [Bacteroidetes bacterium]|nr:sigma-70 family RNA polymerase sigma factor [Bacteroidota bacterium]
MKGDEEREYEEQLISSAKDGNVQAFEALVRKYQKRVLNLAYLMIGDRDRAEDVTQDVFVKVYKKLHYYSKNTSFYSWLYRLTVNECIDELRKRKIRKVFSLDFLAEDGYERFYSENTSELPTTEIYNREQREVIQKALQMISKEHREVLLLREYENYGYNEIAETLGISVQAVKSRIFRARQELRVILHRYFKDMI